MGKIEKWFKRIPKQDRIAIEQALERILRGNFSGLHLKKLKGYECIYRVRVRNYRIVYYNDGQEIILKTIKKRDEATYKGI